MSLILVVVALLSAEQQGRAFKVGEENAREAAVEDRLDGRFIIAPKLAAGYSVAPPAGFALRGALELGYRLPFLRGLVGLSIEPGVGGAWVAGRAGVAFSVPLLLSANIVAGPGMLRVLAGPALDWQRVEIPIAEENVSDETFALGLAAGVSYGLVLGTEVATGVAGIEARYRVANVGVGGVVTTSHVLMLGLVYAFFL
ncbi:MAG: hypothetical protein IT381_10245 [Deltaproteobacteria bacterium]|nr:hypothetical protein [Deltaproteobacteria bacterium]